MVKSLQFSCVYSKKHPFGRMIFSRERVFLQLYPVIKFISDSPDGQNIFRCIRIWLDFFPQFPYERHDVAVIQHIFSFPHCLVNLLFCKYFSPVAGQKPENIKFFRGKRNFRPFPDDFPKSWINGECAANE